MTYIDMINRNRYIIFSGKFSSFTIIRGRLMSVLKYVVLFLFLQSASFIHSNTSVAQTSVSFQIFYDELSPYVQWMGFPD